MQKIKTSELTGSALDWAVAKCEGLIDSPRWNYLENYKPSKLWAQGGPIIERESLEIVPVGLNTWAATSQYIEGKRVNKYGPTPLIAVMRCYVASKLGDVVEVPKELI